MRKLLFALVGAAVLLLAVLVAVGGADDVPEGISAGETWTAAADYWVVVGNVEVNGTPTYDGSAYRGDITVALSGTVVFAEWGATAYPPYLVTVAEKAQEELDGGCGRPDEGCAEVWIHVIQPDGSFASEQYDPGVPPTPIPTPEPPPEPPTVTLAGPLSVPVGEEVYFSVEVTPTSVVTVGWSATGWIPSLRVEEPPTNGVYIRWYEDGQWEVSAAVEHFLGTTVVSQSVEVLPRMKPAPCGFVYTETLPAVQLIAGEVYTVSEDCGVLIGAVLVNGRPVYKGEAYVGDVTRLRAGAIVSAPWGATYFPPSPEKGMFHYALGEYRNGCGRPGGEGCNQVLEHYMDPDGILVTRVFTFNSLWFPLVTSE